VQTDSASLSIPPSTMTTVPIFLDVKTFYKVNLLTNQLI